MSPQLEELARDLTASERKWSLIQVAVRILVWVYAIVATVLAVGFVWRAV